MLVADCAPQIDVNVNPLIFSRKFATIVPGLPPNGLWNIGSLSRTVTP